jgi:murein DD-endopeptidase MepM/ murein hydrolase activator NlpD
MSTEGVHHRSEKQRYTIVVLPAAETASPKRITVSKLGIAAVAVGAFLVVAAILLGVLIYTPLGVYVPISDPELENRYRKQIVGVQERLEQLSGQVFALREYNERLRRALGEPRTSVDTPASSQRVIAERREPQRRSELPPAKEPLESMPNFRPAQPSVVQTVRAEFPMSVPARGYLMQGYDPERRHFGMDIAGTEGSVITAAADGVVIFSGWTYDDGYMIMIGHGSGYQTSYKHNEALLKEIGARVRRGEPIALLGSSGRTSSGPHLHFEVWKDAVPQDPKDYILAFE